MHIANSCLDLQILQNPSTSMGRFLQCCREFIKALPATETPEVFGMHENANIAFEVQELHRVLDTILAMQPRLATLPGSTTPDQQVAAIAASILDKLPPILSMTEAGPGVFERTPAGQLNSLAVVLRQEMERFNRLSQVMSSSLEELQKALQGLVVMSGELELMSTSLLNSQVNTVTAVVYNVRKHARCLQMTYLS